MANTEHLTILEKGVEVWNQWRRENPTVKPDLSGANLRQAYLPRILFFTADLNGADLREANFSGANLAGASLCQADLHAATLSGAILIGTNFYNTILTYADLHEAQLDRANLTGATLTYANLSDANLYFVRGMRLDSTFIRNARFSPRATDPWSILRRNYTGPKLLLHILFLLVFAIPYVTKTMLWVGVNRIQQAVHPVVISTMEHLEATAEHLEVLAKDLQAKKDAEGGPLTQAVTARIEHLAEKSQQTSLKLSNLGRCLGSTCKELPIWKTLIGVDQGPLYSILSIMVILYNLCRALLTWAVGPLRDMEERSGYSPIFTYRSAGGLEKKLREEGSAYGWMIWPHRMIRALFLIALTSFAVHAHSWLTTTVWLPE